MLKELFDLVKGEAKETVINNPDVPNQYNNDVVAEATNTVASGLRNVVAGGGVQNVLSMFGGNPNKKSLLSNPIVSMMMGHFASKLMNKFSMKTNQANNLSGNLIPNVLGSLINKSNDANDSTFSLEKLLASITGGRSNEVASQRGGPGGLLDQFNGRSQSNGNGFMDIVKSLAGGAQEQQQRNGGSLLDLIKGFTR
ncbi:MAG: hypothetical protein E6H07_08550 [Bacteroidetes bacterium]|nr:MAG: hypothetical protein E6H07_08550 [Bacteroidota bacterium]